MKGFIEVTEMQQDLFSEDFKFIFTKKTINIDNILQIKHSRIDTKDLDSIQCSETYEEIKQLIINAQK